MNVSVSSIKNQRDAIARNFVSVPVAMLFLFGVALLSRPAVAQSDSVPRERVVKQLDDRHAETLAAIGVASNGGVIEVFTTRDGSTWTLVMTMPNGMSRMVASGASWIER